MTVTQTTDTSVRVAFDPGDSARTSKVYLDGVLAAEVKVPKGATTASATIKSLVALSSHSITVVSSNVVGSAAATAPLAFTLYPTLPATIGQPAASQTVPNTVRITIPATPNATKYALLQDGVAVQEATASGGSVVFDVADLVEGHLYTFTVVAKNPRMSAPASRFVGVTVFAIVDVAPDVSLDTQYNPGNVAAVAVTFSQLTGTDGYRIYVDGVLAAARAAASPSSAARRPSP